MCVLLTVATCPFWCFSISARHLTLSKWTFVSSVHMSIRLAYCNSLLSGLPNCALDVLQRVQNASARVICQPKSRDHVSFFSQFLKHGTALNWLRSFIGSQSRAFFCLLWRWECGLIMNFHWSNTSLKSPASVTINWDVWDKSADALAVKLRLDLYWRSSYVD